MTIKIKYYSYNKCINNENTHSINTFPLFFPYISDHVLTGDEALGWALQGSLITNTYVSAVQRIQEEYLAGVEKTDTIGELSVTYKSSNGFKIADISQKSIIDEVFNSTGFADYYILDSTNNQFYLPRNKNFIQFTDDTSKINDYVEAGLPNIRGEFDGIKVSSTISSGCVKIKRTYASNYIQSGPSSLSDYEIDASLYNPIYGKSESVQPQVSLKLLYYKVGNIIVNESEIDIAQLTSDVQALQNNKANKDLSNVSPNQAFVNNSIMWNIPDYAKKLAILQLPSPEKPFMAPAAGVVFCAGQAANRGKPICWWVNDIEIVSISPEDSWTADQCVPISVEKDDKFYLTNAAYYTYGAFFPFKGTNNEGE